MRGREEMKEFLDRHRKIVTIVLIIGIICIVLPVLGACNYTYLCEDDFSFEGGAKDLLRDYGSSFVGASHRMSEYYNSDQGTYFFNFLANFLMIYSRFGLPGFHLFMSLELILFVYFLLGLIRECVSDNIEAIFLSLMAFILIFSMPNTGNIRELFFWYTGSLNFVLGFWLSFAASFLMLRALHGDDGKLRLVIRLIFSSLCAFLSSGVALPVTAFNCALLLAIIIISFDDFRKKLYGSVPFIFALAGALINAVAPGNFLRSESGFNEGHVTVFDAIRDSALALIRDDAVLFGSRVFVLSLIITFAVSMLLKIRVRKEKMTLIFLIVMFAGTFLIRYFVMFPLAFGYHVDSLTVNMRTTAAYEIASKLMWLLFTVSLSQFFDDNVTGKAHAVIPVTVLGICLVFGLFSYAQVKSELKEGMTYMTYWDFRSGDMLSSYKTRQYVLSVLESSQKGSDVVIYAEFHPAASAYGMGLESSSDSFVNVSAAGLFDYNTVTVIYE